MFTCLSHQRKTEQFGIFFVLPQCLEVVLQYILNMIIPPCVGIFHPNQFHLVCPADFLLLCVAAFYHFILEMLPSVQFNDQNRQLVILIDFFVDHKIEPAGIKQVTAGGIVLKYMGDATSFSTTKRL